jgi:hypothetical protein
MRLEKIRKFLPAFPTNLPLTLLLTLTLILPLTLILTISICHHYQHTHRWGWGRIHCKECRSNITISAGSSSSSGDGPKSKNGSSSSGGTSSGSGGGNCDLYSSSYYISSSHCVRHMVCPDDWEELEFSLERDKIVTGDCIAVFNAEANVGLGLDKDNAADEGGDLHRDAEENGLYDGGSGESSGEGSVRNRACGGDISDGSINSGSDYRGDCFDSDLEREEAVGAAQWTAELFHLLGISVGAPSGCILPEPYL